MAQTATRRADYAEQTRLAIVDAAKTLFAERGYFATRVEDVATAARVAPKTVYAVVGGKQGLLRLLVDQWIEAPVMTESLARIKEVPSAEEVLEVTSAGVRQIVHDHIEVIATILATAPHDPVAAEGLERSIANVRAGLAEVAHEIGRRNRLQAGIGLEQAADVLFFYFGVTSYLVLIRDNGWTFDQAEQWLTRASAAALLTSN